MCAYETEEKGRQIEIQERKSLILVNTEEGTSSVQLVCRQVLWSLVGSQSKDEEKTEAYLLRGRREMLHTLGARRQHAAQCVRRLLLLPSVRGRFSRPFRTCTGTLGALHAELPVSPSTRIPRARIEFHFSNLPSTRSTPLSL